MDEKELNASNFMPEDYSDSATPNSLTVGLTL